MTGVDAFSRQSISHDQSAGPGCGRLLTANGLALGDHPGFEQVELDVAFHVGDGGLAQMRAVPQKGSGSA
jgi:hypothetical protein